MKQQVVQIPPSAIDSFFDVHVEILNHILTGKPFKDILHDFAEAVTRFDYLEATDTFSLLSFDDKKELRGAYPISPTKTDIRISVDGIGSGYAMCAIDSLGVPYLFDAMTVIESADPATKKPITITIDPHQLDTTSYTDIRVTVPKALPVRSDGEAIDPAVDFCPLIGFFESADSVPEDQHQVVNVIPFDDALKHGKSIFNLEALKGQLRAALQAVAALYPADLQEGNELADTLIAQGANPMLASLDRDEARKMLLNHVTAKGLVQLSERADSREGDYELTPKGRRILEAFIN